MKRHEWKWRFGCDYTERGQRAEGRWSSKDHEHAQAWWHRTQGSHLRCRMRNWSDGARASWAHYNETNAQRRRRVHDENRSGREDGMTALIRRVAEEIVLKQEIRIARILTGRDEVSLRAEVQSATRRGLG